MPAVKSDNQENNSVSSQLITHGSSIKMIKNDDLHNEVYPFANFPVNATDEIFLRLRLDDAQYLVQKNESVEPALAPFFERLASNFDGQSVQIPYVEALAAI